MACNMCCKYCYLEDNTRDEKTAIMYVWQFGINGRVIMGRTWQEFFEMLNAVVDALELSDKRFLYIYVHNLAYEFQFIRKWFDWTKIFALKKRKVLYAQYAPAVLEFRCSYLLANAGLAHVGDKLLSRYPVKKMVGDLDYSQIRHSQTPLTKREIEYCTHDDFVVMAFIQEKIEQDCGIDNIPLTNTGYVRRFCRNYCMSDKLSSQKYHTLMRSLQITEEEELVALSQAADKADGLDVKSEEETKEETSIHGRVYARGDYACKSNFI